MTDLRRTRVTSSLGPSSVLTRVDTSSCRLVVENTVSKGNVAELVAGREILVGADTGAGLQIEDPTVSREHAKFTRTDGGARIVDLGSTNGTFYERSRVTDIVVPFGSTVMVGRARVKVVPHETEVQTEPSDAANFGALVGRDMRMRQMFSLLADVAPTDATVVIEGETGTGKELVASALHEYSERKTKPFVVFDCSAVPHDLVESSLFGHIKGSFTGATANRQGAFKRAHGGTIFLDEIGELPLDLQPKLLRAIESRTIQMVGGDGYERVDVRVVAATNRNLKQEVRAGRFREDLYYRLAVVRIVLPSLRERSDDIELLVEHFLRQDLSEGQVPLKVDPGSWAALRDYPWPGNVRELKNLAMRARSLSRGQDMVKLQDFIQRDEVSDFVGLKKAGDTPAPVELGEAAVDVVAAVTRALDLSNGLSFRDAKTAVIEAFERQYLQDLIGQAEGNISRAAQQAQMDRKHLRELLKKNGLWQGEANS